MVQFPNQGAFLDSSSDPNPDGAVLAAFAFPASIRGTIETVKGFAAELVQSEVRTRAKKPGGGFVKILNSKLLIHNQCG